MYKGIFGDDFFLELQDHKTAFDERLKEETLRLGKELGIRFVATNNVHYLEKRDAGRYQAMVAIRTKERLSSPHLNCLSGTENYFKTAAEMQALLMIATRNFQIRSLSLSRAVMHSASRTRGFRIFLFPMVLMMRQLICAILPMKEQRSNMRIRHRKG